MLWSAFKKIFFQEKLEGVTDEAEKEKIIMEYAEKMQNVTDKFAELKERRLKAMRNRLKKERLKKKGELYK